MRLLRQAGSFWKGGMQPKAPLICPGQEEATSLDTEVVWAGGGEREGSRGRVLVSVVDETKPWPPHREGTEPLCRVEGCSKGLSLLRTRLGGGLRHPH